MKAKFLLPNRFKTIGLVLLFPFLALGIACRFFEVHFDFLTIHLANGSLFNENINLTDELALTGIIVSLYFIAFAREKQEDEFINRIRLESLQWAVIINYGLLLMATWVIHGFLFIDVMMWNMLTVLIIFVIRFNLVLNKNKHSLTD